MLSQNSVKELETAVMVIIGLDFGLEGWVFVSITGWRSQKTSNKDSKK